MRHFRTDLAVEQKSDASPVTIADRETEERIVAVLRETFPDHGILGQEHGAREGTGARWIVDPIDGTKSFIRGIPYFACLVGRRMVFRSLLIAWVAILCAVPACAAGPYPDLELDLLLDARVGFEDDTRSWLAGGLGKTRYGQSPEQGRGEEVAVGEASLVIRPRLSGEVSAAVHLKYDPEQQNAVDIVEAFLRYRPVPKSPLCFKVLAGAFFPPVSLENDGVAWTSP